MTTLKQLARHTTKAIPKPYPMGILMNIGNFCNFACTYCPESFDNFLEKQKGRFKISLEDFKMVVDQCVDMGHTRSFDFELFGEPFAHPLLLTFVKMVSDARMTDRIKITSNGSLIKPEKYEAICESGLDFLKISIYGTTEETHQKKTQSKTSVFKIKENIAGLKKYRDERGYKNPFIYVKMIHTPGEDETFLRDFSGVGDSVAIEPLQNWNDVGGNMAGIDRKQLLSTRYMQNDTSGSCAYPFYFMAINSDLTVAACAADWDKQLIMGDMRKQTLAEIWNGPKYREIRKRHLEGKLCGTVCENCSFKHVYPHHPLRNLSITAYLWALKLLRVRRGPKLILGANRPKLGLTSSLTK